MALSADEWKERATELGRVRERTGHSQSHVARVAHVAPGYISRIESGEVTPSERVLKAYAEVCRMDLDALLLSWHRVPSDLVAALRKNPLICARIRQELAVQG